jgi:hypothetical protein
VYWKDFEPSELLDYESCLVAFMQELPFQKGRPLSPIAEEGKVAQSYSSTDLGLTTRQIVKSVWPPFAMRRTTSCTPSTTMNNSRTSQPMSPQLMLPKMKTRSTEGSGGQRMPSALNAGATRRTALAHQGILTTVLQ